MGDFAQFHRQLGTTMKLTQFAVDDGPHNSDGLLVDILLSDITESGETLDATRACCRSFCFEGMNTGKAQRQE